MTSKEELQSLNEELTALNSQLQETLERQRTTSNDLQNVLNSTDVATLCLDSELRIRFFTPAIHLLFNVIASDVAGLSDFNLLVADDALLTDARKVCRACPIGLRDQINGWRMVQPPHPSVPRAGRSDRGCGHHVYRHHGASARSDALEATKREAELANVAKSRFLGAASHDLRQPLQTLVLLQGLLSKIVEEDRAKELLARLDDTLSAMSAMLNTLLDINQIEAGVVRADIVRFRSTRCCSGLG